MSTARPAHPSAGSPPLRQHEVEREAALRTGPRGSHRRDKPQLSCNLCRSRKLRCDRQRPCSSCSTRGRTCTYVEYRDSILPSKPPLAVDPSIHDRLVHLERLVMSLMPDSADSGLGTDPRTDGNSAGPSHVNTSISERSSECGSMQVGASELRYVGGDHWAAILDGIADLKYHFDRAEQLTMTDNIENAQDSSGNNGGLRSSHALLLYGYRPPASRAEVLAALPPKSAVDRYISRYFNHLDLAPSAVHGPTFLQEYETFWANPSGVPIVWVGLLFSMICLAVLAMDSYDSANGTESEQQSLQIDLYREKIVQCLVMGEYTKSGPYVLETVFHYVYIEFCIRADADKDVWFLLAIAVYLAMRMGYHRDPSHFTDISPLHGEMRRRLWAAILQGDILISSQMGMPRMISDFQCDTAEPRNLNDADLDQNTAELPPSRPETEHTTVLGVIARRRLLIALGKVSDLTAAVRPCSYAEVMRVDGILHDAAASVPPPLTNLIATNVTDSPQVIMSRLFNSHMFYKGQVMLHQKFLFTESPSKTEDSFLYSRKACLDASLGSLQIQHVLDEETCPGGQLHMMRWRISSIMNHQFLTATMILCSLLHRRKTLDRKEQIVTALRRTRTIWMRNSSRSREAQKAAETVSIVLARAEEGPGYRVSVDGGGGDDSLEMQGIPSNYPTTTNGSDSVIDFGSQQMLQDTIDLSDRFVMPGVFGIFAPAGQQSQNFAFNPDILEKDPALDEWMLANGSGSGWQ